jgi:hypothetical protein
MRMYVNEGHTDWDDHLPYTVLATNSHANESTGYTPNEVLFGRNVRKPIDAALNFNPPLHLIDSEDYVKKVKEHFTQALTTIPKLIQAAQVKYKQQYDKTTTDIQYKVDDLVLIKTQAARKGQTGKFKDLFHGPYKVIQIQYPNLKITDEMGNIDHIHVNNTKPYKKRDPAGPVPSGTDVRPDPAGPVPTGTADFHSNQATTSSKPAAERDNNATRKKGVKVKDVKLVKIARYNLRQNPRPCLKYRFRL